MASTTTSPYPTALTTPREVPRAGPSRSGLPNRKPQDQEHKTRKTPPRPVPIVNQPGYIRECDGHRHICVELVVPVEAVGDKLKGRENFYISQLGLVYLGATDAHSFQQESVEDLLPNSAHEKSHCE